MGLNLWRGHHDAGRVALAGGGSLVVAPEAPLPPGAVLVSARPSSIGLHRQRPDLGSARNVWPGRVATMERLGERVRLQLTGSPEALVDLTAAAVAELRLAPGEQVWLSVKATELTAYPDAAG
ncbi:TOBE domain-containing protein [Nocardioides aequoreus]|uniref:TOBE domain-containing protein n=1 Tax=Nocardioides aequoreus TaxID=397278 RepID=UPI003CCC0B65